MPPEGVNEELIVTFTFAEEPGFVEGYFLFGGVSCLVHSGQKDGVLAVLLIHLIDGIVEGGSVLSGIEQGGSNLFWLLEVIEGDADT